VVLARNDDDDGSTTCALTFFMHHVIKLLEENSYVRCLMIDFSKAFDVVRHDVLSAKLAQLNLPPSVLQWIISFLNRRTQQVKRASSFSFLSQSTWAKFKARVWAPLCTLVWLVI